MHGDTATGQRPRRGRPIVEAAGLQFSGEIEHLGLLGGREIGVDEEVSDAHVGGRLSGELGNAGEQIGDAERLAEDVVASQLVFEVRGWPPAVRSARAPARRRAPGWLASPAAPAARRDPASPGRAGSLPDGRPRPREPGDPVAGGRDAIALRREQRVEQAAHARIVFDDEHLRRRVCGSLRGRSAPARGGHAADLSRPAAQRRLADGGTARRTARASAAVSTSGGASRRVSGATVLTRKPAARNARSAAAATGSASVMREPQPAAPHAGQQRRVAWRAARRPAARPPLRRGR